MLRCAGATTVNARWSRITCFGDAPSLQPFDVEVLDGMLWVMEITARARRLSLAHG